MRTTCSAWHAEVKRLSDFSGSSRDAVRGGFMDKANWTMRTVTWSVASRSPRTTSTPARAGGGLTDLGRYSKARAQLQVSRAAEADVLDGQYKTDAAALLTDIKNEKDET